jgi:hypothetical protein
VPALEPERLGDAATLSGVEIRIGAWAYVVCDLEPFGAPRTESRGCSGIPFAPVDGPRLEGQLLALPRSRVDWLHFLLEAPEPLELELVLCYRGGIDPEHVLVVPDDHGLAELRVGAARRDELRGLRLPRAPEARLVALTVARRRPTRPVVVD